MKGHTYSKRRPFPFSTSRTGLACGIVGPFNHQCKVSGVNLPMGNRLYRNFMQALVYGYVDPNTGRVANRPKGV